MNARDLFSLINDIPEEYIVDAMGQHKKPRIAVWKIAAPIAACIVLCVSAAWVYPKLRVEQPPNDGGISVTTTALTNTTTTTSAASSSDLPLVDSMSEATSASSVMIDATVTSSTRSDVTTASDAPPQDLTSDEYTEAVSTDQITADTSVPTTSVTTSATSIQTTSATTVTPAATSTRITTTTTEAPNGGGLIGGGSNPQDGGSAGNTMRFRPYIEKKRVPVSDASFVEQFWDVTVSQGVVTVTMLIPCEDIHLRMGFVEGNRITLELLGYCVENDATGGDTVEMQFSLPDTLRNVSESEVRFVFIDQEEKFAEAANSTPFIYYDARF